MLWDVSFRVGSGRVVLGADDLEDVSQFGFDEQGWGRYLDIDGDGIPYRTIPGTHPSKGGYFTRGTSKDEYARYTEKGEVYKRNVDRLTIKFNTAKRTVPKPEFYQENNNGKYGLIFYGTTTYSAIEAMDEFTDNGSPMDAMRIKAFPFGEEVEAFIDAHEEVFVIEQNKDGQMRTLLINEFEKNPKKLIPILNYNGYPITSDNIINQIGEHISISELVNS